MPALIALALSVGVLAVIDTWLFGLPSLAAANLQVWISFIAWGTHFQAGGKATGSVTAAACMIFGAIVGMVALILAGGAFSPLGSLAAPLAVGLGAALIVLASKVPYLGIPPIGFYGFAAIAVFMTVYYLMFGFISVIALGVNLLLLVGLLSILQATLTLPGMAAIALTIGMAIDANVLINERIRDELRNGIPPQAAINAGYERAFGTILDSNITTLIAGIALFAFGSGPVKGFAVVLCLGILTSMFSAVMVSRGMVNLVYGNRRKLERISIGQVWKPVSDKR